MALIAVTSWAANYPATRYLLEYHSAGSLMLLRFFIASVIFIVVAVLKKTRLPKKKDMHTFILGGFVGVFVFSLFLNLGAAHVPSGVGSFIINSSPVFVIILSRIVLKEVVKPICWIGVFVSFCGLMAVMVSQTTGLTLNIGVFYLLVTALATSVYNVIQRGLLKKYSVLEVTTFSVVPATICMLIFVPDVVREMPGTTQTSILILLFASVFPAAIAYLAWAYALSKAEKTTHVTVFLYLTPFIATLLGYLFLQETISIWSFFGGVVIIAGMVLTNTLGKSTKKPPG
jgi:drug/metabolite transporter (DMT)-like permease